MKISIQTPAPQPTVVVDGESIPVELTLSNEGNTSLTLPELDDPSASLVHFVLSGPSFRKPNRFHFSGAEPDAAGAAGGAVVDIVPGQSIKAMLALPNTLALPKSGLHELHATYAAGGTVVRSNMVRLKVAATGPAVFRVVGRTPPKSEVGIQALAVHDQTMYLATFHEERPDLGETRFFGFNRLATTGAGATDFFAPWCQAAEAGEAGPRFGWRQGNAITVAGYHKQPQRLDVGFAPRVHGPSLMAKNGDIDVLVTDEGRGRLLLLRFPHVGYDQTPPAALVVWTADLPEKVVDLVGTMNPEGTHRALLRHASSVRLISWDDRGPKFEAALSVPGLPVAGVGPALHLSQSGIARASVLTAEPAQPRKVSLTEIVWPSDGVPQVLTAPPIDLTSPVHLGTVAYSMASVESPRREWVFVLDSHRVQTSQSEGKARVTKRQIPTPPVVLVMKDVAYDLEIRNRPELNMLD